MAEAWAWNWEQWASQGAAHRRVWAFLTLDIQQDRPAAIALLAQVNGLLAHPESPGFTRSGNAYYLTCRGERVILSTLVVEEPDVSLALSTFQEALLAWIDSLREHP